MNTVSVLKEMLAKKSAEFSRMYDIDVDIFNQYKAEIAALTDAIQQLEWVKVSDRLPEARHTVMFSTKHDGYRIGSFEGGNWITSSNVIFSRKAVTHWKPLPPAPEGA